MRIFIKDISIEEIKYLKDYPIQGLVFSIYQENAEKIREIIENTPFYLTIIGELHTTLKYEIEELIFFCKLKGIIMAERGETEESYSCPLISKIASPYNAFLFQDGKISTANMNLHFLEDSQDIEALALTMEEFFKHWPLILKKWTNIRVV